MKPDQAHLAALIAIVQNNLRATIVEHLNGQPRAQAYDSDRTSSGAGPSDPTYTAAVTPDRARTDLELHDQAVDRAYRALLTLAGLSDKYIPTHEPRRGTMQADTKGCTLHDRAGITEHQPAKHCTDFASVLTTPLRQPIDVCLACYNQTRATGQLPTTEELVRHHRTGKWRARTAGKTAAVFTVANVADWQKPA